MYADHTVLGRHEGSPVQQPEPGDKGNEEITGKTYGWLKAHCERAVEEVWAGRNLIVRPSLLVGPHDFTGRFSYWPWRVARGGEVLAPDRPDLPVQILDARDLADWILRSVEEGRTGLFNAIGPRVFPDVLTLGDLLETCREVTGSDAASPGSARSFSSSASSPTGSCRSGFPAPDTKASTVSTTARPWPPA